MPNVESFVLKRDGTGMFVTAKLEFRNRAEGEQAIHAIKQMMKVLDTEKNASETLATETVD